MQLQYVNRVLPQAQAASQLASQEKAHEAAYSLTAQDVEDYLATKQDEDTVGIPCDSEHCLLAQAFKHKYPHIDWITVEMNRIYIEGTTIEVLLNEETVALMNIFDDTDHTCWGIPTTKREWMEARARANVYLDVFGEAVIR
jgi:hypothetical protein